MKDKIARYGEIRRRIILRLISWDSENGVVLQPARASQHVGNQIHLIVEFILFLKF